MLTCRQVEAFVIDYHEGQLPEKQRKQFDLHLALCPMCRVHFESYLRSIALGQALFKEEDRAQDAMPEELVGAILLAAEEREG